MGEALPALFHYAQEVLGVEIISGLSNAKRATLATRPISRERRSAG
jgi:hypothetical protein